ncbi:TonB-dependent siderophore receptor [Pseudorhodoferax sp. Leaf267]|uniref:TonB-dependent siderophore receptor n=1 Tax=Pseudorhodoferax sp. Leaf267 TaxID=1736316 RepID=UPI0006F21A7A|nr:TonB-dependent siderophore receptor [Pseudorhodoferax sp. Leaf267]KQP18334.1 TonB-dependent receptor [Pseudorhodoferax sp. Leaf267]
MNRFSFPLQALAGAAAALCALAAAAQAPAPTLPAVTVQAGQQAPRADVTGFGDQPLRELPLSVTVIDAATLQASGARRLADLTRFDASVTDAYNSPGYWDYLTIRGFTLDNRFNYRREGLPISAETSIPLDNKDRIEILKGTSGIQAGTSAPGGLVNYAVKRPTENDLRRATVEVSGNGGVLGAIDLSGRFGVDRVFGYRFNVAHETLRPRIDDLDGRRSLVALAADWRVGRDTVVEAEVEWSRKSQPSQAGYSLLGNILPAVPSPHLNLNNQPWSQPSVFGALTGTVRIEQALTTDWSWSAQVGQQRLKTDDRLAYAFGCTGPDFYLADRYCSDGSYDLYDFRSENEQRRQTAAQVKLKGRVATGGITHDLGVGLLHSRVRNRFQAQAYNYVGVGNVDGTAITTADPTLTDPSTNRDERSLELSLQDTIRWSPQWTTWLGLRHTRLDRESVRTDGSRPTGYDASLTTPWVSLGYQIASGPLVYASYGQGVESELVPNRASRYSNAGVALPVRKSRQWEVGAKGGTSTWGWQLAWFRIERPVTNIESCTPAVPDTPCEARYDGNALHQGLEATLGWAGGPWRLDGGFTLLDAERRGSTENAALNGTRPVNVPRLVLRAKAAYTVAAVPGLALDGGLVHEGRRSVLPDQSIELPSWTRLDAGLRYAARVQGLATHWTLGVENLANRRYWKESPTQFGHVYLFTGTPRTVRLAMTADF